MKRTGRGLGIFLLLAGTVFLLHELGAFNYIETTYNVSFWGVIWSLVASIFNLWPLLLIIFGINIIFNNKVLERTMNFIFIIILIVNAFLGPFYYFGVPWINNMTNWNLFNEKFRIEEGSYNYSNQIDYSENLKSGTSEIDLGACELIIGSIEDKAAKVESNIKGISADLGQSNDKLNMYISEKEIFSNMNSNLSRKADIYLGDKIPWEIKIITGASTSTLNLSDLKVSSLKLELGAGDTEIHMGDKEINVELEIDGGVSNIKLYLPIDAAILINTDSGLSSNNFDALDLIKTGESQYTSKNYDMAKNKFNIIISTGVSNIDIYRE